MVFRAQIVERVNRKNGTARLVVAKDGIEKNYNSNTANINEYKIRIPLLHGASGGNGNVDDKDLPYGVYSPFPGTEATELAKGTVVYVASIDIDFSDFIIFAVVPGTPISNRESHNTALENITTLSTSLGKQSEVTLNGDVKIKVDGARKYIDNKNLTALKDWQNGALIDYTWPMKNGGTGVSIKDNASAEEKMLAGKKLFDNFGAVKTVVIRQDDFDALAEKEQLDNNTLYFVYTQNDEN